MEKPQPLEHVYAWSRLKAWLESEAPPGVYRETSQMVDGWRDPNGTLRRILLKDHEEGLCGDELSAETLLWLKTNIAHDFSLWVCW